MLSWPAPSRAALPGTGLPARLHDTATGQLLPAAAGPRATMYVCGITPYDAAHLGHAATYVAFDLLYRVWLDAGVEVAYVQNVTDVDDPLLERAAETADDWRDLAERQTRVYGEDMAALAILPPTVFVGVTEVMKGVAQIATRLLTDGAAYQVPIEPGVADDDYDLYYDVTSDPAFGSVSGLDELTMLALFAERGGDPDRPGKRHRLDPVLWRAARPGEPSWPTDGLGPGRPGWHVECTAIALEYLGMGFDVQGGGSDLVFPHHELSASHARVLTGETPFARIYAHAGMVGLDGEKMSKSTGNLVFVHALLASGMEAPAIRLALLNHHYRTDWQWTSKERAEAITRLRTWREAVSREHGPPADAVLAEVRGALADDLDAPAAVAAVDRWCAEQLATGGTDQSGPGLISRLSDTLLGVRL